MVQVAGRSRGVGRGGTAPGLGDQLAANALGRCPGPIRPGDKERLERDLPLW